MAILEFINWVGGLVAVGNLLLAMETVIEGFRS